MKVIVAGSRDFNDEVMLSVVISEMVRNNLIDDNATLVCGMARGADRLAETFWKAAGLPIIEMPADWDNLGKGAGFIRNGEMGKIADVLVAFWDGKSRGTAHMIETMRKLNKPVHVIKF